MEAIVTIPPYAPYIRKIARHPIVSGVRLNTVMPVKESLEDLLTRIKDEISGKDLWIDLKCRQVRVTNYASVPYEYIEISHDIDVNTPTTAYFSDGSEEATIARVDGRKIIMLDGPKRIVGPGESINIPDASLKIKGYLTDQDKRYIEAACKTGLNKYMLSYVEEDSDITDLLDLDNSASVLAKIESRKGLKWVDANYAKHKERVSLMAARGDLYVELKRPHQILGAVKSIISADKNAVLASRIFPSLRNNPVPVCSEISDIGYLTEIGYRRYMIGDDVCFNENSVMSALNLLEAISKDYAGPLETL